MSKRSKLEKFAENLHFPNVFENLSFHEPRLYKSQLETVDHKGRWARDYFKNEYPITLELACGGGEYCLGLAGLFPERNYIGVDIKGARIWKGARKAISQNQHRVAFVRTRIELLPHFFDRNEIQEIWITFPDPFLRKSKSNRRLTSPFYLNTYKSYLQPGSLLHLKTDDETLYAFSMESLEADPDFRIQVSDADIYHSGLEIPELELKTYYEFQHLAAGKSIKYIRAVYQPQIG
jgi:tRNA (guanine-N7-)-methyltransferase